MTVPTLKHVYLSALSTLLRPVLRACLKNTIKLGEITEIVKQTLVQLGAEELVKSGEIPNATRLTVMTGVHRKDCTRILGMEREALPEDSSMLSRVVGLWQGSQRFTTSAGKPRVLTFEGKDNEFSKLVSIVSRELNPGPILKELKRTGMVEESARGIALVSPVYIPKGNVQEALTLLASDEADLFAAVENNISSSRRRTFLHIKTEFDGVPTPLLEEVNKKLLKDGSLFHEDIERYLSENDKDVNGELEALPGRNRVAFISFVRIEEGEE